MSLFSSIRMAANTLRMDQIALQVVGQNMANANTPGYIREEVLLSPAPTQRLGRLLLGMGVEVEAVIQKIDRFLEERLRGAVSEMTGAQTEEHAYIQLEGLIGEPSDIDLSTSLSNFFSSISEILNQPESVPVRNLAVLQGVELTSNINWLAKRVRQVRSDLNDRIPDIAARINDLTEEIRRLNIRIVEAEGGDVSASDAVGLRDQRLIALENLAKLINIQVEEKDTGAVTVYNGGTFLVSEGVRREVVVSLGFDRGLAVAAVHFKEGDFPLDTTSGELTGLMAARDEVLGGFLDQLDDFAHTLAFEFNKIFSGGQGLRGFEELSGEFAVDDADVPLDQAGLKFTPVNGSFQIMVYSTETGLAQTTDIFVDLDGLGSDMTLNDLAAALDAVDGLSAEITPDGNLTIRTDLPETEFAFADDTSGLLAALGLNTFFSGSAALDLGVNPVLLADPAKFAASRGGIGVDTENLTHDEQGRPRLAQLIDRPIPSHDGDTLAVLYDRMTGDAAQGSAIAQAVADGARVFEQTLRGQKSAISGVSLDEEAIRLIAHQHSFQASARYIATLGELLNILVAI